MHPPPSGALILFKGSWSKVNAQDRFKAKKTKRICQDKVSVNAKSQCTRARPVHWFFFVVPKCASIFLEVPKCASIFFWSSKMCIDFFLKFQNVHRFSGKVPACASIFGWSSWQAHRFWGEVLDMCIDFLGKFQHVHRFLGEVLDRRIDFGVKFLICASIFWESSSMCIDFLGKFQHVHRFFGKVPACASIFWGSSSMCIDFLVKFQHVHRFWGEVPACPSIFWGGSRHVHRFCGEVLTCAPKFWGRSSMCIYILGRFETCASVWWGCSDLVLFWGGSSHIFLMKFLTYVSKQKRVPLGALKSFIVWKWIGFGTSPCAGFLGLSFQHVHPVSGEAHNIIFGEIPTCAPSVWKVSMSNFQHYVPIFWWNFQHVHSLLVEVPTKLAFTF